MKLQEKQEVVLSVSTESRGEGCVYLGREKLKKEINLLF